MSTKYLTHYLQEKQDKLFAETGAFFAFSQKQFDEQKKEGVTYTALDMGMLVPTENAQKLVDGLVRIQQEAIAQDLAENGKDKIIERELHNHEAFYTMHINDAMRGLERYGLTRDEVQAAYNRIAPTITDY